jgi:hypothetical protein
MDVKIDLQGMTLLDFCRAHPEQVVAAIEQHNKESQPPCSDITAIEGAIKAVFDEEVYVDGAEDISADDFMEAVYDRLNKNSK